jgi:FtsZ-binding cell division protein ZapB
MMYDEPDRIAVLEALVGRLSEQVNKLEEQLQDALDASDRLERQIGNLHDDVRSLQGDVQALERERS